MKLHIQCLPSLQMAMVQIVGLDWYDGRNGYIEEDCPCLAVCYQTGHIQIMRSENDDSKYTVMEMT